MVGTHVHETIRFLTRHGYTVVFVWVFAEQVGLPIPSIPILLAAGALAGSGQLSLTTTLGLAVVASLLSDSIWYELGQRRGHAVLNLICRISLEPDSCVRRTEDIYTRHGSRSLSHSRRSTAHVPSRSSKHSSLPLGPRSSRDPRRNPPRRAPSALSPSPRSISARGTSGVARARPALTAPAS